MIFFCSFHFLLCFKFRYKLLSLLVQFSNSTSTSSRLLHRCIKHEQFHFFFIFLFLSKLYFTNCSCYALNVTHRLVSVSVFFFSLQKPPGPTFKEFILFLIDNFKKGERFDEHWTPIYSFCTPCSINYTLIAKVETFQRDTEYIIRQSGLETLLLNKMPAGKKIRSISNESTHQTAKLINKWVWIIQIWLISSDCFHWENFRRFFRSSTKHVEFFFRLFSISLGFFYFIQIFVCCHYMILIKFVIIFILHFRSLQLLGISQSSMTSFWQTYWKFTGLILICSDITVQSILI